MKSLETIQKALDISIVEDLKEAITEYFEQSEYYEDFSEVESFLLEWGDNEICEELGDIVLVHTDKEGCALVFYFDKFDIYVQIVGYYSSMGGWDFEDADWSIVTPYKKTITLYQ